MKNTLLLHKFGFSHHHHLLYPLVVVREQYVAHYITPSTFHKIILNIV